MDFSRMNQRITFLENRTVIDEIGNHTSQWDEVYSCWASVTVKSSAETTNTGVTKEIQSLSFGVRQCAFIRCVNPTTHKVLFRGSVYDIKSVTPDYLKSRPATEGKTKEDSTEVKTETLSLTAPALPTGLVKAKTCESTDETTYNNWYKMPYNPDTSEKKAATTTKTS